MSNGIENLFMDSSFLDKIKYKKVRVRLVKKEGKTYVKYAMVPRFKIGKSVKYGISCFFILVVLGWALS